MCFRNFGDDDLVLSTGPSLVYIVVPVWTPLNSPCHAQSGTIQYWGVVGQSLQVYSLYSELSLALDVTPEL